MELNDANCHFMNSSGISVNAGTSCITQSDKESSLGQYLTKTWTSIVTLKIYAKTGQKLHALVRVANCMNQEKLQTVMSAFIFSQCTIVAKSPGILKLFLFCT